MVSFSVRANEVSDVGRSFRSSVLNRAATPHKFGTTLQNMLQGPKRIFAPFES